MLNNVQFIPLQNTDAPNRRQATTGWPVGNAIGFSRTDGRAAQVDVKDMPATRTENYDDWVKKQREMLEPQWMPHERTFYGPGTPGLRWALDQRSVYGIRGEHAAMLPDNLLSVLKSGESLHIPGQLYVQRFRNYLRGYAIWQFQGTTHLIEFRPGEVLVTNKLKTPRHAPIWFTTGPHCIDPATDYQPRSEEDYLSYSHQVGGKPGLWVNMALGRGRMVGRVDGAVELDRVPSNQTALPLSTYPKFTQGQVLRQIGSMIDLLVCNTKDLASSAASYGEKMPHTSEQARMFWSNPQVFTAKLNVKAGKSRDQAAAAARQVGLYRRAVGAHPGNTLGSLDDHFDSFSSTDPATPALVELYYDVLKAIRDELSSVPTKTRVVIGGERDGEVPFMPDTIYAGCSIEGIGMFRQYRLFYNVVEMTVERLSTLFNK